MRLITPAAAVLAYSPDGALIAFSSSWSAKGSRVYSSRFAFVRYEQ
jgi:hypothetical protein